MIWNQRSPAVKSNWTQRALTAEVVVQGGCWGPDLARQMKFCLLPPKHSISKDLCKNYPFGNEKIHGKNKLRTGNTGSYVGGIIITLRTEGIFQLSWTDLSAIPAPQSERNNNVTCYLIHETSFPLSQAHWRLNVTIAKSQLFINKYPCIGHDTCITPASGKIILVCILDLCFEYSLGYLKLKMNFV